MALNCEGETLAKLVNYRYFVHDFILFLHTNYSFLSKNIQTRLAQLSPIKRN